jgi:hypothetical protein
MQSQKILMFYTKKKKDVLLTMNIHFKRKLKSLKNASNSSILNEKLVKENEVLEA